MVGKQYGVIQNPSVRVSTSLGETMWHTNTALQRRTGKRPLAAAPRLVTSVTSKKSSKFEEKSNAVETRAYSLERPSSSGMTSISALQSQSNGVPRAEKGQGNTNNKAAKPANSKREQSDLFKSFSKPLAKVQRENTGSSVGESSAPATDQSVSDYPGLLIFKLIVDSKIRKVSKMVVRTTFIPDVGCTNFHSIDGRCLGR